MAPILEVEGLTVTFGGVTAVDRVEFALEENSILGVIGPNGAGKTTMFDAISGFVPARGRVVLQGERLDGKSPEARSRARLGRSFQDAKLFPSLTVAEALAVSLERHIRSHDVVSTALSMPWVRRAEKKVRARVDELIGLMGLGAFRDKFVSELSTGSRRIVDLAVIMGHDPLVLLLDEPSSGIAQRETEALGPMLRSIRDETGTSIIVIEHDMPLVNAVSDRLLALETGRVMLEGEPEEVMNDPRLVAAYLGTDQAVLARSGAAPAKKRGAKKAPAKKSAAKKAPAKKSAAQKAAVKKTTAKKSSAKKAPAKTSAAKKSAAKKAAR